jgi:hypothetical protein
VVKTTSYKKSMEGAGSPETLVPIYQTTWHHIIKGSNNLGTPEFVREKRWQNVNYDCHLYKPILHLLWM